MQINKYITISELIDNLWYNDIMYNNYIKNVIELHWINYNQIIKDTNLALQYSFDEISDEPIMKLWYIKYISSDDMFVFKEYTTVYSVWHLIRILNECY
jgi:hypothetical protein